MGRDPVLFEGLHWDVGLSVILLLKYCVKNNFGDNDSTFSVEHDLI